MLHCLFRTQWSPLPSVSSGSHLDSQHPECSETDLLSASRANVCRHSGQLAHSTLFHRLTQEGSRFKLGKMIFKSQIFAPVLKEGFLEASLWRSRLWVTQGKGTMVKEGEGDLENMIETPGYSWKCLGLSVLKFSVMGSLTRRFCINCISVH